MTLYAPTSVPAVGFNPEVGGCGTVHTRGAKETHLAVSCPPCEALIIKYHTGWGRTPAEAALTDAELAENEAEQRRGQSLMAAAGVAMGEKFAELAAESKTKNRKVK